MIGINSSIIIGVISGILTSFVIWLGVNIFQKIILPWYQSIIYEGLRISGSWIGFYGVKSLPSIKDDPDYSIFIRQKGHHIEGNLIRNKNQNGTRDIKEFVFTGIFRDGNLVFSYRPEDKTRLGLGSYVMKLGDDGKKFEGNSLYITSGDGRVAEFSVTWIRKVDK